ncbi:vanadium-dependent haloperoxidase [Ferruginibacter paludis]|uniref:vanadium-dependent haloperoxidase n=1 Tax=Ferruginibacter paludis TaxID=1310417 RepID=UPI0025B305A2|nr:vanadium-dependent haloperoxidase [Ferruginibacter paludis]MDN3659444.1 vanadium-dependent haloperoxidase [Ferruginibacter paludis]
MRRLFVCLCIVASLYSCKQNIEYKAYLHDPQLFSNTVHELNSVVMGNNFPPMIAARNYTYGAIAAYEVIAAGYPKKYQSLVGQVHGLTAVAKPAANTPVDFELAALLAYIKVGEAVTFPEGSMQEYKDSILKLARDKGLPENIETASQTFADSMSASIIRWSKKDNYAETRSAEKYTVRDEPGRWVPTPPMYAQAAEPHWMEIRTMAIDSANQFLTPPPIPFDITDKKSKYYEQLMAIKNAIDSLTDEQKHIADFWDDNPFKLNVSGHVMFGTKKFSPSGHWMSIIGIAAKQAKSSYDETVYAYAKTSIALFDAFIQCWQVKYTYNTVRPETVINKYIDPNWRPYLQTPAFPEYTCGHSTISSAAAEALTDIYGDNFAYTDSTELEFGIQNRNFTSFRQAALENNSARFYGGIHFHPSCIVSNAVGKQVGDFINGKLKMKK